MTDVVNPDARPEWNSLTQASGEEYRHSLLMETKWAIKSSSWD